MSSVEIEVWSSRYQKALEPGVIKQRGEVLGVRAEGLRLLENEEACVMVDNGLRHVCLVTDQAEQIVRAEIERALAHARMIYTDTMVVIAAGYGSPTLARPYPPTFITGLAGCGKSCIRSIIGRVLAGRALVRIDSSHASVPLIDYCDVIVGPNQTPMDVLTALANPEIASRRISLKHSELTPECARWQQMTGGCLIGVDEMQFMSISAAATTRISTTLLAIMDVRVPWFVIANFSLAWKLQRLPSEVCQRLLSRPVVVLPDRPGSADWASLLEQYQIVLGEVLDFELAEKKEQLWSLCAGVKRLLVELLVQSYRILRRCGRVKIQWTDVIAAYNSVAFSPARADVDLLVAHAGQGGYLRQDLRSPFTGPELNSRASAYAEDLRASREVRVARATVEASMTSNERVAFEAIAKSNESATQQSASVIEIAKPKRKKTLDSLLEAGAKLRDSLA